MCYDINGDSMLQLMPISENNIEKAFYLAINDLDFLAHKASTLTPFDAWQEVDGYNEALFEYMQSIKYNDKELFNKYDKLIHANRGSELLKYAIELYLMEKDMKLLGISPLLSERYNLIQQKYICLLNELKANV